MPARVTLWSREDTPLPQVEDGQPCLLKRLSCSSILDALAHFDKSANHREPAPILSFYEDDAAHIAILILKLNEYVGC